MRVALLTATLLCSANALATTGLSRRGALLLVPSAATTLSLPAAAETGNVGTAAERLERLGTNAAINSGDPRCGSGVFLNFKPGTCSPLGNLYDAAAKEPPTKVQDSMDDLAASFMQRSSAQPVEESKPSARSSPVSMMAKQDDPEEWKPPGIFSAQNAGPFAILIIVGAFQALLPIRDQLPVWLQDLIPLVLGRQAAPPGWVAPDWFFWY